MPIYEYYCPENHTIYQFYAKTLAQGRTVPKCPDNPLYPLVKMFSPFAVKSSGKADVRSPAEAGAEDTRLEAAMGAMEKEFSQVDENDPRAMGRMMRRMADLSGEKIGGEMEEVVRKLEEGADPEALEEQLGGEAPCHMEDPDAQPAAEHGPKDPKHRYRSRGAPPIRDPRLHDYP